MGNRRPVTVHGRGESVGKGQVMTALRAGFRERRRLMHWFRVKAKWFGLLIVSGIFFATVFHGAYASDHLDTPTVIADPAADIGDIFAWTSSDGRRLNLVMDIVAHQFSDRLQYVFHVDSGERFGKTTATTLILCRFDVANAVEC